MAKKEVIPNPELRRIGLEFYKGPFRFDHLGGYVWAKGDESTSGSQMFADLEGASERCARIRGWGALQYLKDVDCEALQDEIGVMFAEAITEYWDRQKNTRVYLVGDLSQGLGEAFIELQRWVDENGGAGSVARIISRVKPGLEMATKAEDCDYFLRLVIPTRGINATLRKGDSITFLQGNVFVEVKPCVIHPSDIDPQPTIGITLGDGRLGWTPPEQQN